MPELAWLLDRIVGYYKAVRDAKKNQERVVYLEEALRKSEVESRAMNIFYDNFKGQVEAALKYHSGHSLAQSLEEE